jgi:hypothetical protein
MLFAALVTPDIEGEIANPCEDEHRRSSTYFRHPTVMAIKERTYCSWTWICSQDRKVENRRTASVRPALVVLREVF